MDLLGGMHEPNLAWDPISPIMGQAKKAIADMPPFNTTNWHPPELDMRIQVMNVKYLMTLSYTERYVCQSCYIKLANNMIRFSFSVGVYFSRASQFQPLSTRSLTWPLKNDGWKTTFLLSFGNFSELLLLNLGRVVFGIIKTSWWFQPIWKICSSNWIISPGIGVKKKYLSCHHLEKDITYSKLTRPYRANYPYVSLSFHTMAALTRPQFPRLEVVRVGGHGTCLEAQVVPREIWEKWKGLWCALGII